MKCGIISYADRLLHISPERSGTMLFKKTLHKAAAVSCAVFTAIMACGCSSMGILDQARLDNGKDLMCNRSDEDNVIDIAVTSEEDIAEDNASENTGSSYTCTLLCAGDNFISAPIYSEALELGGGDKYDFTRAYEHIEKYVKNADVAIVNQETLVTDKYLPQGDAAFVSPTAVGDKLVDMGFNAISMSNNHVLDMGDDGMISSLDYWDTKDVVHYGAYRGVLDSDDIKTMEVNGITFAFLGYTEHTNNIFLPDGSKGEIVYLDEIDRIRANIQAADKIADVVVVSCHYGTEIENELNDQQQELTPQLVEWGADLILGTQSHTVSSCAYIDKPDGSKAFVYYGLGNLISTIYDPKAAVGMLGTLTVVKDPETGTVSFENVKAIPIISHFEGDEYSTYNCTVYPYAEYTDDLIHRNCIYELTRDTINECISYIPSEFLSIE